MADFPGVQENVEVRVEVFEDHLMLILPRKMDDFMIPWQEAWVLGEIIERAAEDIPNKGYVLQPAQVELEQSKLHLNTHQGKYVVLLFEHTDRIRLSHPAAQIVGRSTKLKAQDLNFESHGIHISYKEKGRVGRPTPIWEIGRKVFDTGRKNNGSS